MTSHPVSRRMVLTALGGAAAGAALAGVGPGRLRAAAADWTSGYVPDGTAGLAAAFPSPRSGCSTARCGPTRRATRIT